MHFLWKNIFVVYGGGYTAAKFVYTNENHCLSPSSIDNTLVWIAPHFQKKILGLPLYDFSKISTIPINKGFHTMTPQSIFALTCHISIQLSLV